MALAGKGTRPRGTIQGRSLTSSASPAQALRGMPFEGDATTEDRGLCLGSHLPASWEHQRTCSPYGVGGAGDMLLNKNVHLECRTCNESMDIANHTSTWNV